ncbi:hypothetical protein BOX15_Mlig006172g2 [Macrostomum lignano]|uniref:Uncharacterized protein n=1 Tax=Macrostomum lignano TaxID=282301 RepID=A0A267GR78_9PLAT|nr:hypothetical protein BOX15_Mlig006172g2 [Macrostomum lignano]
MGKIHKIHLVQPIHDQLDIVAFLSYSCGIALFFVHDYKVQIGGVVLLAVALLILPTFALITFHLEYFLSVREQRKRLHSEAQLLALRLMQLNTCPPVQDSAFQNALTRLQTASTDANFGLEF